MIEWHLRKRAAELRPAIDHRKLVAVEMRTDKACQQRGRLRRKLARLEQHAIPRGERRDDRQDRELEGVVPGADHADDAERLAQQVASARLQIEWRGHRARTHPSRQMPARMAYADRDHEHFGEPGFLRRTGSEVGGDRRDDRILIALGQFQQAIKPIAAYRERGIAVGLERTPLRRETRMQIRFEPCPGGLLDDGVHFGPCVFKQITLIAHTPPRIVRILATGFRRATRRLPPAASQARARRKPRSCR